MEDFNASRVQRKLLPSFYCVCGVGPLFPIPMSVGIWHGDGPSWLERSIPAVSRVSDIKASSECEETVTQWKVSDNSETLVFRTCVYKIPNSTWDSLIIPLLLNGKAERGALYTSLDITPIVSFWEDCIFVSLHLAIAQTIETAALCMQTVTIFNNNPELAKTKTCGCFWSIHLSAMPGF